MSKIIDLTIGILTYNHETFIEKVIDSMTCQKTTYSYEIIVNDDASSDTTSKILKRIQKNNSNIEVIFNKKNSGENRGLLNILNKAKGRYLLIQDGDDHWCYSEKIQKQVSFLEKNSDYVAVCHDAKVERLESENSNNIEKLQTKKHYKFISQFTNYKSDEIVNWDLLMGETHIQSSTLMFRRFNFEPYLHLFRSVKFNLDWIGGVILSMEGKIRYINEPWSVYVDHPFSRTKNNYFFNYFLDKVLTLRQLTKFNQFKYFSNKKDLYHLLALQYIYLLENNSGGQKTKKNIFVWMLQFYKYHVLSGLAQISHLWHERRNLASK